ncbi:hypothetical protein [Micavibrio aeruginosavorus]|uniref:Tetratricopeptide repeat family protein n=1 Tax=Micavibrio aeruginosavorus (strain ARL-13) TaxID=856793 RepID=G2KNB7_MICAA|nr:hypothetical protein [Micavibrio aeruginosavorus]AEP09765.1 hypothetical protein MICA_1447 [Micavibrio aeruginosavorus ARL-13]
MIARFATLLAALILLSSAGAQAQDAACAGSDTACILSVLDKTADTITDKKWRDQTLREVAKLYAAKGNTDQAIAMIGKIENPDTRALTIRGIGMAVARLNWTADKYGPVFTSLQTEAAKIDHAASHAIALTYIAMSQAYAGDDAGATATAKSMTNAALRNKAFAENAEIQAARGDVDTALASLAAVEDAQYRDKQAQIVAKILTDSGAYDKAIRIANSIATPYAQAQAMLYIAAKQITPHESDLGQKDE